MMLADMGADVLKIERREGGDDTRTWGPPFLNGGACRARKGQRERTRARTREKSPLHLIFSFLNERVETVFC
jgi:crotonobetainyl-CoA:carnitine CoA-transferase CaiB-like acyl-CoA transferase